MQKLLAFDYGASSGRGILGSYDGKKLLLSEIHRFSNDPVMVGDTLYWDILRLYYEMKQSIVKCAADGDREISSIGIDTWGVDFGLLDSAGRLLGNPTHYRDKSTSGMIDKASKFIPKREIYESTGTQIQSFNTLYQLLSMKLTNPPLLDNASTMLFIPDLLRYFLTGEKSTEYTIASTAQMLDPVSGSWAKGLLKKLGIPQNILTEIIDAGTITGKLTSDLCAELGVDRVPVVAVAEHDTASAVVAVPAVQDRVAYLSSGTWSLLGIESNLPFINDTTYSMNYTNEGGMNRATRLLKNIMGLWIYQECKRSWEKSGELLEFDTLEAAAAKEKPFIALIDPDDSSFYRPGSMPEKIQEYCRKTGQIVPETKAQIVRCILESLALKYRMALEGLENIIGYKIPLLHVVGGGSKNAMLSQFTADAIARPVLIGPVEATAIGNLVAQLIALGEIKNLSQGRMLIRNSFETVEYHPKYSADWDAAYEKFLKTTSSLG